MMADRKTQLSALLNKIAEDDQSTYSATLRVLNKEGDKEKRQVFMKKFKDSFDNAMNQSLDEPQSVALLETKQDIDA